MCDFTNFNSVCRMGYQYIGRQSTSCRLSSQWKYLLCKAFTSQMLISLSMCIRSPVPSFLVVFKTLISRIYRVSFSPFYLVSVFIKLLSLNGCHRILEFWFSKKCDLLKQPCFTYHRLTDLTHWKDLHSKNLKSDFLKKSFQLVERVIDRN